MRKKTITTAEIIEATIHLVAENGLENLSTRKVAARCGISDGCLFNYFENKNKLLTECLYHIDNEIDKELSSVSFSLLSVKKSVRKLWFAYFDFLLTHGDYAKFYRSFRHSSYYTYDVVKGQDKSFTFFVRLISKASEIINVNLDIFWVYIIETTLNFAIRAADKQLPYSERDKEKYFALLANGIGGVFRDAKDWDNDDGDNKIEKKH